LRRTPAPLGAPSPEGTGVPVRALRGIAPLSLLAGELHSPARLLGGDQVTRQRTTWSWLRQLPGRNGAAASPRPLLGKVDGPLGRSEGVPRRANLAPTTRIWTDSLYFSRTMGSPGTLTIAVAS